MDVYHQTQTCYFPVIFAKVWSSASFTPGLTAHPTLMITDLLQASLDSIQIHTYQNKVEDNTKQD